ncbi:MAG: hypothetical protein LBS99_00900, partial [Clostridiales bacterium]|nr:hypothetical protein [Clostridiales bacterium]
TETPELSPRGKRERLPLITAILLFAAAAANVAVITAILSAPGYAGGKAERVTSLRVTVRNAADYAPIHNATVCIPEINSYFYTDTEGKTVQIEAPILVNRSFDRIKPRDFGDITLLVYKDGYIDYIIFYVMLTEAPREITITLYPSRSAEDNSYHTIIESPDSAWAAEVIDKYKK